MRQAIGRVAFWGFQVLFAVLFTAVFIAVVPLVVERWWARVLSIGLGLLVGLTYSLAFLVQVFGWWAGRNPDTTEIERRCPHCGQPLPE